MTAEKKKRNCKIQRYENNIKDRNERKWEIWDETPQKMMAIRTETIKEKLKEIKNE
jgi:hypothetical protein